MPLALLHLKGEGCGGLTGGRFDKVGKSAKERMIEIASAAVTNRRPVLKFDRYRGVIFSTRSYG
jgi:hypothetical protein